MKKTKSIPWTFSIAESKDWQRFISDPELRQHLLAAIKAYDEQITYLKDTKKEALLDNIEFERSVLLDHIELIVKSHLESLR